MMTEQDKKKFAVLLNGLGAAFRCDVGKETMAVYFQCLSDYNIENISHAVEMTIKTGERFPVVAKLREQANTYRKPDNRKPLIPAFQIAEFTEEEAGKFTETSADEFFKQMCNTLGEKMGA